MGQATALTSCQARRSDSAELFYVTGFSGGGAVTGTRTTTIAYQG